MHLIAKAHSTLIYGRRVRTLAAAVADLLPPSATVLDVGCGDGLISSLVQRARPDVRLEGLEVLVRPETHIPIEPFDGTTIPRGDASCDAVMLIDVLHHCDGPGAMVREAARVARRRVVIKDHLADKTLARARLRFMDYVGNAHHGVRLPYNYLRREQWDQAFDAAGLRVEQWRTSIGLYGPPASWVFERGLHFLAALGHAGRRNNECFSNAQRPAPHA